MADELKCSIEFDDEWRPSSDGCHWDYDRIFYLTYKILDSKLTTKEFYYRLGTYEAYSAAQKNYTRIYSSDKNLFNTGNTWTYELRLSDIALDKLNRTADGWVKITAYVQAVDSSEKLYTAYSSFDYYLELPPQQIENLKTELVITRPGELKCSWTKPTVINDYIDEVDGYSIEVFHRLADSSDWLPVSGLAWDEDKLAEGIYKLITVPEGPIEIQTPEALEGEEEILSFNGSHLINREILLDDPDTTEFFFVPKTLGIKAGDSYKIVVYPYSHYLDKNGDGSEALLSIQGTEYSEETSKGIVRVKTAGGWVEGQVWVMTEGGWKQAEAIYAMTENGWKEAQ